MDLNDGRPIRLSPPEAKLATLNIARAQVFQAITSYAFVRLRRM